MPWWDTVPGPSPDRYTEEERAALLGVARASLAHGLREGRALPVDASRHTPPLQELRATFVTLREDGALRGCIGHFDAVDPLIVDVALSAYRAGFADPRFPDVTREELPWLRFHISILSPPLPMSCTSEEELLAALRPGVDGLVLREGLHSATFLPAVWESLPEPKDFLRELKHKAGLPPDHWSSALRFQRYTALEVS